MAFSNPILGGDTLIRNAIQSENYVPGVSGWAIFRDGTAEFNDITARGDITANRVIVTDNNGNEISIDPGPLGVLPPTIVFQHNNDPEFSFSGRISDEWVGSGGSARGQLNIQPSSPFTNPNGRSAPRIELVSRSQDGNQAAQVNFTTDDPPDIPVDLTVDETYHVQIPILRPFRVGDNSLSTLRTTTSQAYVVSDAGTSLTVIGAIMPVTANGTLKIHIGSRIDNAGVGSTSFLSFTIREDTVNGNTIAGQAASDNRCVSNGGDLERAIGRTFLISGLPTNLIAWVVLLAYRTSNAANAATFGQRDLIVERVP